LKGCSKLRVVRHGLAVRCDASHVTHCDTGLAACVESGLCKSLAQLNVKGSELGKHLRPWKRGSSKCMHAPLKFGLERGFDMREEFKWRYATVIGPLHQSGVGSVGRRSTHQTNHKHRVNLSGMSVPALDLKRELLRRP
jgi:hypothetical protein